MMKTALNNVVLPTSFNVVNNIVQHCWAWIKPTIKCNNAEQYCWQHWTMWAAQHCSRLVSSILNRLGVFTRVGAQMAQAVNALCLSPMKLSLVCDVSCERVSAVDLSCASRVFLRVLRFSSFSKSSRVLHFILILSSCKVGRVNWGNALSIHLSCRNFSDEVIKTNNKTIKLFT